MRLSALRLALLNAALQTANGFPTFGSFLTFSRHRSSLARIRLTPVEVVPVARGPALAPVAAVTEQTQAVQTAPETAPEVVD